MGSLLAVDIQWKSDLTASSNLLLNQEITPLLIHGKAAEKEFDIKQG